jgi:hypothetical protein
MTDAMERAAREMWRCEKERAEHADAVIGSSGECIEPFEETADCVWRHDAARMLLAFLDEGDEAMVATMAQAIANYGTSHFGKPWQEQNTLERAMRLGEARAALTALRAMAEKQG